MLKTIKAFEEQGKAAQKKQEAERVKDTRASLALGEYAGTYKNDLYGDVKVTHENGKLAVRFGPLSTAVWSIGTTTLFGPGSSPPGSVTPT